MFHEFKPSCNIIDAAGEEHLRLLLVQGLTRANLSHAWSSILLTLCKQAAYMILPGCKMFLFIFKTSVS